MGAAATFVGASQLIALLDRTDPEHRNGDIALRLELDAGPALVTTNYEVVKASLELRRRHGIDGPRKLLGEFLPFLHVEWCSRADHATAVAVHLSAGGGPGDLVDCVSAEIIRRTGATPMYWIDR